MPMMLLMNRGTTKAKVPTNTSSASRMDINSEIPTEIGLACLGFQFFGEDLHQIANRL